MPKLVDVPTPIQLFEPLYRTEECLAALREVLNSGWVAPGAVTQAFEAEWKAYTGLPQAHFVSSATAGLHLALEVLKRRWRPLQFQSPPGPVPISEAEVITTPLTFVSTNHAILYAGLKPVFADVDSSLCLDPEAVARAVTPRTRAVLFVGLGGNPGRLTEMERFCLENQLDLILDAAHMAGTRLGARGHAGAGCAATVFSFQTVKNLPTGDGGMVCFDQYADDQLGRKLSWMGIDKDTFARQTPEANYKWQYDVPQLGYKYAGNAIAAAIGRVGLRYLDRDNAYRRQLAAWYDKLLPSSVGRIPMACDEPSRHLYQILHARRDELLDGLQAARIHAGVHYRYNGDYPMYADQPDCPRARQAAQHLLSLPLHLKLTRAEVTRICEVIGRILG